MKHSIHDTQCCGWNFRAPVLIISLVKKVGCNQDKARFIYEHLLQFFFANINEQVLLLIDVSTCGENHHPT